MARSGAVEVDVPARWSVPAGDGTASATSLVGWWRRFDDPLLSSLIDRALRSNTSVVRADATLRESRALRDVAAAALLPSLTGSASAQRSSGSSGTDPGGSGGTGANRSAANGRSIGAGRTTTNTFQAGLDASWELDVFGVNRSALNVTEATLHASAASLGDVQVSTAAEVALDYIALRSAQARLAIANDNLASQQQTLQITSWRQQAGLTTALDVEQARAAAEQTGATVPALQTSIDQQQHALAVLVGLAPAALQEELSPPAPLPRADPELALRFPAETLRQRADVRAAEDQVVAASARVSQADAARLPSLSIGGSLGLSSLTLGALTGGASVVDSLLASVSVPLFDGGAARSRVGAQQAALDEARQDYRATMLQALKDVEDALVALRDDDLRQIRLAGASQAAGHAATLASQRYSSGLIDFQTVLQTQRTRLDTQDALASVGADVGSDHVRLYKALGGGWSPDTAALLARSRTP